MQGMPNHTSIHLSSNILYSMYGYRSIGKLGMLSTKIIIHLLIFKLVLKSSIKSETKLKQLST